MDEQKPFLFFDLDDTILDFEAGAKHALADACRHIGIDFEDKDFDVYRPINLRWWQRLESGQIDSGELRVGRFVEFLETTGRSPQSAPALAEHYISALGNYAVLYPGARELLRRLDSDGFCMGMITNGLPDVQPAKIRLAGIGEFFDPIIISGLVGCQKPEPEIFDIAKSRALETRRLAEGQRIVMIGDSLSADIGGADSVGWETIWFDPSGRVASGEGYPDRRVGSWDELGECLLSESRIG